MRLHTGAKPFKCPHCELRFRTSGRRKTHIQCHFKSEAKKARKPGSRATAKGLQPVNLLNSSTNDPNVFIMNNSVLTGQFDQNLLQQSIVGQAILPASMSGKHGSVSFCFLGGSVWEKWCRNVYAVQNQTLLWLLLMLTERLSRQMLVKSH